MRMRLLLTHKQAGDINNKGHLAANREARDEVIEPMTRQLPRQTKGNDPAHAD